jgi:hypothetical protein
MTREKPIEIARNKKNLAVYLAGGLLVFCCGLVPVIFPHPFMTHTMITTFIPVAVGTAIMVAAGIYIYIMAVRVASVFPAMIISEKDIYDHTGTPGDGLINWDDISEFRESKIVGQRYLTIVVKHPQLYIERQRNPAKRLWLTRMNDNYGSPIQIPAKALHYDFDELMALLKRRLTSVR